MERLLKKASRRRLKLLEFLACETWVSLDELNEVTGSSRVTLLTDIERLQEANDFYDLEIKDHMYCLSFKDGKDLRSIYVQLMADEPAFNIIEFIFFNMDTTYEEIAEHHYQSVSSIYNTVATINEVLQDKYSIGIESGPIRLSGDPDKVRSFFYQYFTERYSTFDWPFADQIDEDAFTELIKLGLNMSDYEIQYPALSHIKTTAAVNAILTLNGFVVDADFVDVEEIYEKLLEEHIDKLKYLRKRLPFPINLDFLKQIFVHYLNKSDYISPKDFNLKLVEDSDFNNLILGLRNELIKLVKRQNLKHTTAEDIEELSYYIYSTALFGPNNPNAIKILHNTKSQFVEQASRDYPAFFMELSEILSDFLDAAAIENNEQSLSNLIYTATVYWDGLINQLQDQNPKLKLLILSQFDYMHSKMLADYIIFYLPNMLELHTYYGAHPKLEEIDNGMYDLILSNLPLKNVKKTRVLLVNHYFSMKDLTKSITLIGELLEEVQAKKISKN